MATKKQLSELNRIAKALDAQAQKMAAERDALRDLGDALRDLVEKYDELLAAWDDGCNDLENWLDHMHEAINTFSEQV